MQAAPSPGSWPNGPAALLIGNSSYATIQPSRDCAVGAFTNLGGGQDLRTAVGSVAPQIATRLSTGKKLD
jgi:hypothetical protein